MALAGLNRAFINSHTILCSLARVWFKAYTETHTHIGRCVYTLKFNPPAFVTLTNAEFQSNTPNIIIRAHSSRARGCKGEKNVPHRSGHWNIETPASAADWRLYVRTYVHTREPRVTELSNSPWKTVKRIVLLALSRAILSPPLTGIFFFISFHFSTRSWLFPSKYSGYSRDI